MDGSLPSADSVRPPVSAPGDKIVVRGFDAQALDASMLGATSARHVQVGSGRFQASIDRQRFATVAMRVNTFSIAVRAIVQPPPDVVTLGLALDAPEPFLVAGHRFPVSTLTVFGPGQTSEVRYPAGSRTVTLAMPSAFFARQIAFAPGADALQAPRENPSVRVDDDDLARLKDIIVALERLRSARPLLPLDPQWLLNVDRTLVQAFFRPLIDPSFVPGGARDRLRSARMVVHEAEARMAADPMSIPSIPALCADLGISRRTLERAFIDLLDMSPARYLRVRALNAVRVQLLRSPRTPGMVTRVAIDNGFWHLGRFSASYRALFGEHPIDTLRQSRPDPRLACRINY